MDGYVTIGTKLDTKDFEKSLNNLQSGLEKKMDGMTNTVTKAFTSLKKTIIGLGLFALIRKMFNFDDAVSRVDTINNYARVMGNLGISSKDAQASIQRLSDALMGLPTTLDDAALSVQRFTSANGNIQASTEMFLALNNAILAGGANTEIQKSAIEQLSQAYAKGRPDMMEWRTAMMAMPAQLKQVALAMGYVSADQLGEALRSGTVSMNEFMTTIIKLNKNGVNGFQSFEEQARNSTGGIRTSITNLKTAFTRAFADILNAIGQSNIAEFFNGIARAINKVVPYIAAFVKALLMLFGINNKKQADDTAKSFDNLGSSVSSVSDDLGEATGLARKLNKELKGLASFDEMNVLPDKAEDTSGGVSGGSGAAGSLDGLDFSGFETDLGEVTNKVQELADKIYNYLLPIIGGLTAALLSLKLMGFDPIVSLGIGVAVAGLILLIQDIIKFIQDPSWEGFAKILADLAILLTGVAIAMIAVNASNPIGWITLAISAILALASAIIKYRDEIKKVLLNVVTWISVKIINPIVNFFSNLASKIRTIINTLVLNIKTFFGQIPSFINGIISKIVTAFKNLGKKAGEVIGNAFKTVVNGILKTIEDVLNTPIKAINKLLDKINDVPGINLTKLSTLKLPRLARGGIINMPGRGIPVGNAIAGERGREAVLPLTDTQQMQLLGEAIGRYITLNATIPVQIGNRLVAREIKRINAENDFAFNR